MIIIIIIITLIMIMIMIITISSSSSSSSSSILQDFLLYQLICPLHQTKMQLITTPYWISKRLFRTKHLVATVT